MQSTGATLDRTRPDFSTLLEFLKPVTWFPPMWAYGCGAVSAGVALSGHGVAIFLGILLAGPLVCACSQAVNDWYDRHVDAINQPERPIPSGRLPGRWGWYVALLWTALSLLVALALGPVGLVAAIVGIAFAWAYSAPPLRLKQNGWWGNLAVGLCYEGLPWVTAAAILLQGAPPWPIWALAILYSLGAHGIMTLNDFKSVAGDRVCGVGSLPVRLGIERAAKVACAFMLLAQCLVVALLAWLSFAWSAIAVAALIAVQAALMVRFLRDPVGRATWLSALGVQFYVAGMMISAFAVRELASRSG